MAAGKKDKPKSKTSAPKKPVTKTAGSNGNSKKAPAAKSACCSAGACKSADNNGKKTAPKKPENKKNGKGNTKPCNIDPLDPAEIARQEALVIEEKKKLHREIFAKCVEKKLLQELDFWGN